MLERPFSQAVGGGFTPAENPTAPLRHPSKYRLIPNEYDHESLPAILIFSPNEVPADREISIYSLGAFGGKIGRAVNLLFSGLT